MNYRHFLGLGLSMLFCELAGVLGSFFTLSSVRGWYLTLAKPALNPPSFVFGPVWTLLYALMGVALYLVLRQGGEGALSMGRVRRVRLAVLVFLLQLSLNILWSVAFFGLQSVAGALVVILLLWLSIVWTMQLFAKQSRAAAWMLVPYLLWVTFAVYLNLMIWTLN